MYVNIEKTTVQTQLKLYGSAGDKVIGEYLRLKPLGHGKQIIVDAMEAKIDALGPSTVSRHCGDFRELNVIDISPKSIASPQNFLAALQRAKDASLISKFLSPVNGDPAFHIEIRQPGH